MISLVGEGFWSARRALRESLKIKMFFELIVLANRIASWLA